MWSCTLVLFDLFSLERTSKLKYSCYFFLLLHNTLRNFTFDLFEFQAKIFIAFQTRERVCIPKVNQFLCCCWESFKFEIVRNCSCLWSLHYRMSSTTPDTGKQFDNLILREWERMKEPTLVHSHTHFNCHWQRKAWVGCIMKKKTQVRGQFSNGLTEIIHRFRSLEGRFNNRSCGRWRKWRSQRWTMKICSTNTKSSDIRHWMSYWSFPLFKSEIWNRNIPFKTQVMKHFLKHPQAFLFALFLIPITLNIVPTKSPMSDLDTGKRERFFRWK